jgi:hypothetical protein
MEEQMTDGKLLEALKENFPKNSKIVIKVDNEPEKVINLVERRICGHPVDGDADLILNCKQFLVANWEGEIVGIVKKFDSKMLTPMDKGLFPLFGIDVHGNVVCGFGLYPYNTKNQEYSEPHILVTKVNHTGV